MNRKKIVRSVRAVGGQRPTWLVVGAMLVGCSTPRASAKSPVAPLHRETTGGVRSEAITPAAPPFAEPPPTKEETAIRALALAAEACPFDTIRGFTSECEALDRWEAEADLFVDGRNDSALVSLLERGTDRTRSLSSSKLEAEGSVFRDDAGLAARILTVAERETSEGVGAILGHVVASLDVGAPAVEKRVLALIDRRANRALTMSLLEELTTHNDPNAAIDAALARAMADPRGDVRQASVLGLALSEETVVCAAWKRALEDSDPNVALAASHVVATHRRCPSLIDPVLGFIGKGQRSGVLIDPVVAVTLAELCESDGLDGPQRGLAASIAEGFAEPALPLAMREEALRAALACSPDERRFVKRFAADKDERIRRRAKDLLKEGHRSSHGPKKSREAVSPKERNAEL